MARASWSASSASRFSLRRRWTWPLASRVRPRSNGIGRRSCSTNGSIEDHQSRIEVARRGLDQPAAARPDGEGPGRRRHVGNMLEEADDGARPFEVAHAERRLEPVAVDLEPAGMAGPACLGQGPGDRQLSVGRAVIAKRERDEPEDVAVVDLEGQVAALDGQLEPLGGEASSLVGPAVMGRHQRDPAQPP